MQNNNSQKNIRVVVGMSGGVDSSVVACLLKKQGYDVVGLHMKGADENQLEDCELVKKLCKQLDIECHIVDYDDEMQIVKDYFIKEYAEGRTPNPCVICNQFVKFKPFIEFTEKIGADFFATGHYANIEHNNKIHILKRAKDETKDQSYFLNQLSQKQLEKVLFPLGDLSKDEVRKIAEQNNLVSAHKKDSFDVCFVGSQKFKDYIAEKYPQKEGKIINISNGKVIGKHGGIAKYTIGQRKGLGIGGGHGETGEGWFVVKKDIMTNTLYVSQGDGNELYADALICEKFNFILNLPKNKTFECTAKFRYRQKDQAVIVKIQEDGSVFIEFKEKQRAITIGQFAVLYDGENCLGGGVIDKVVKDGEVFDF